MGAIIFFGIFFILCVICTVVLIRDNEGSVALLPILMGLTSLLIVCIGIKVLAQGDTEERTYNFPASRYEVRTEIKHTITSKMVDDEEVVVDETDTTYVVTGRERIFGRAYDDEKTTESRTIDLRKEK